MPALAFSYFVEGGEVSGTLNGGWSSTSEGVVCFP